jgi:hypothetical protein
MTEKLTKKDDEINSINQFMIGRELAMIELKRRWLN